jgi:TRAP-type C4-dicarboxylate transport system substrate-binding protein
VLKGAGPIPPTHVGFTGAQNFIDLVNERAAGSMRIDWLGGTEVIPYGELGEALQTGIVDFLYTWTPVYLDYVPEADVYDLSKKNAIEERESGFHAYMEQKHLEGGLMYIGRESTHVAPRICTSVEARKPGDLAGKTWVFQTDSWNQVCVSLGGQSTPVSYADIYTSFDRGMVQCWSCGSSDVISYSMWEVAPYFVGPPWYPANNMVMVMNADSYRGLPQALQDLILEVQIENDDWVADWSRQKVAKEMDIIADAGMELIPWSVDDQKLFLTNLYNTAWKRFEAKLGVSKVAELRAMMEPGEYTIE